jgi:homoserine acetyltransferase
LGDFKLESGETIRDFCISYVTHGDLNEKKSNAILMVPALGGNHHRVDYLIGPGRGLDTSKYFVIAADVIAINQRRPMGHLSGAGITAPENEFQNAEIAKFLDTVTQDGRLIR